MDNVPCSALPMDMSMSITLVIFNSFPSSLIGFGTGCPAGGSSLSDPSGPHLGSVL